VWEWDLGNCDGVLRGEVGRRREKWVSQKATQNLGTNVFVRRDVWGERVEGDEMGKKAVMRAGDFG
jgi:hypothetical protein